MLPTTLVRIWPIALMALCASPQPALAAPAVFWVSDPVAPGQTALVYGDGFDGCKSVHWERLPDKAGEKSPSGFEVPVQAAQRCVKFTLPSNLPAGIFRVQIDTPSGAANVTLNRPQISWAQGDAGTPGTPGGWVRVCGKCLTSAGRVPRVTLTGSGRSIPLNVTRAEMFTIEAALPKTLPVGDYQIGVSSGLGLSAGWSAPTPFKVIALQPLPQAAFDVPAPVPTAADNVAALQKVLDRAAEHGGTVRLPAGRWLLDGALTIPRNVTLQGVGMNRSALCWVDMPTPPPALIAGTDHFKIADLSIYARMSKRGIWADQTTPTAGHVSIDRVRMRINRFRNHLKPEEIAARSIDTHHTCDALKLGGEDIEVIGCDIYSTGFPIYLSRATGGRVFDNQFYIGRQGSYFIAGSNGLLFERNLIAGTDLESGGGGVDNLDGSCVSQNVYFASNTVKSLYSGDHEGMTADGSGGIYDGGVASVDGAKLTLATDPKDSKGARDWTGAGVFILGGKGQGQYRQLVSIDGRTVTVNAPWTVEPDSSSVISITILARNYLFVGNSFIDTGVALCYYGSSVGHVAYGNTCERSCGFLNFGMNYHAAQPSWYIEWLGNRITDGTVYMAGPDSRYPLGESMIGIEGGNLRVTPACPATLAVIVRGNELVADAHIVVHVNGNGVTVPLVRDVVIEDNRVSNAETGLIVGAQTEGVYSHANLFTNCGTGIQIAGDLLHDGDRFVGCTKEIDDERPNGGAHANP